jgi:acyl carrier protein
MSCEDGCEVLRLVLESPRPQWIISMQELGSVLDGSAANRSSPSARARDTGELSTSRHALEHSSGTEEQTLARIWQDVLGVPEPDVDDDFFALGGDSLLAIQLGTQMERCFGVSFTLRQLLQEPTIAGVAKLLRNANTERARTALDTAEPPARPAGDV